MKSTILSVVALTSFTLVTYAQEAAPVAQAGAAPAVAAAPAATAGAKESKETKTQVAADALPAGVKQTLATGKYKEWKMASAWHITGASEYYVVELQKGEEKTTLKLNKEGQPV